MYDYTALVKVKLNELIADVVKPLCSKVVLCRVGGLENILPFPTPVPPNCAAQGYVCHATYWAKLEA